MEKAMDFNDINKFVNYIYNRKISRYNNRIKYPLEVEIELTNKCNHKCIHCSNNTNVSSSEIETVQVKRLLRFNPIRMVLSGGEPFLNKSIFNIINCIKYEGCAIKILSNGTMIDDSCIEKMIENGFNNEDILQISLDGITNAVYHLQRGAITLDKVRLNIRKMVAAGLNVEIHTVPTTININEIEEICKFAIETKCKYFSAAPLAVFSEKNKTLSINAEILLKLDNSIKKMCEKTSTIYCGGIKYDNCAYYDILAKKRQLSMNLKQDRYFCAAGNTSIYINSNGYVYPCVYLVSSEHQLGNLYCDDIEEIMNSIFAKKFQEGFSIKNTKCSKCEFWEVCSGGCLGISTYNTGMLQPCYDNRCYKM